MKNQFKLMELFTESSVRQVLINWQINYESLSLSAVDKSPAKKYKVTFHASDGQSSCPMIKSIKSIPQELLNSFEQCDLLFFNSLFNLNTLETAEAEAELLIIFNKILKIVNPKIIILDSDFLFLKKKILKDWLENQYSFIDPFSSNSSLEVYFRHIIVGFSPLSSLLSEDLVANLWNSGKDVFILKNEVNHVDDLNPPVSKEEKEKVTNESVTKIHNLLEKWKKNGTINFFTLLHEEGSDLLPFIKSQSYNSLGGSSGYDFRSFIHLLGIDFDFPKCIKELKQKRREVICAWPFFKANKNLFSSLIKNESPDFIAIDKKKKTIGIEVIDFSFVRTEEGLKSNRTNASAVHFREEYIKSQSRPDYKKSSSYSDGAYSEVEITNKNYSRTKKNNRGPLDKHFKKINNYIFNQGKKLLDELIFVVALEHWYDGASLKKEKMNLWIRMIKEVFEENAKDKKINDDILSNIPIKCFVHTIIITNGGSSSSLYEQTKTKEFVLNQKHLCT